METELAVRLRGTRKKGKPFTLLQVGIEVETDWKLRLNAGAPVGVKREPFEQLVHYLNSRSPY